MTKASHDQSVKLMANSINCLLFVIKVSLSYSGYFIFNYLCQFFFFYIKTYFVSFLEETSEESGSVTCKDYDMPTNSAAALKTVYSVGEVLEVKCRDGYILLQNEQIVCGPNGKFNNVFVVCLPGIQKYCKFNSFNSLPFYKSF